MIGHTLAKLYGVMEAEISDYMETLSLRAPEQAGFRRAFSTIDHIFTLRCLIDQMKARKKKLLGIRSLQMGREKNRMIEGPVVTSPTGWKGQLCEYVLESPLGLYV